MRWSSLRRARALASSRRAQAPLYVFGLSSALLAALLVLDLALIVQLLDGRSPAYVRPDRLLGPWAEGRFVDWPQFGREGSSEQSLGEGIPGDYYFCLLVFVGAGLFGALLQALLLVLFQRSVQRSALRAGGALRRAICEQACRLGELGFLEDGPPRAAALVSDRTKRVQRGLTARWRAEAHDIVAFASLALLAVAVNFWLALLATLLAVLIWRRCDLLNRRQAEQSRVWRQRASQCEETLLERLRLAPLTAGSAAAQQLGQSCERAVKRHASAVLWEAHSSATANALLLCLIALGGAFLLLTIGMSDVTVAGGALLGASLACACTPAWRLCGLLGELDAADKAAADIFAYLGNGPSVRQLEGARPMPRLSRAAEVENVTLANAAGRKLLDRVSLTIPAGARVAVVSADWQTHLALASLLGRYCDPASGRVLFDGRDIRSAALETVRTQIALAAADGMCFTGSVEENIRFGDWMATEQQVRDAAKRARADGLIESLPQGLATEIGPHGLALAPDAAFRIGMARALLRQPSLLVIQEPAAQIDQAAWAVIDKALEDAALGRTLVFAPTRLSTLRSVSRLYVFRQGRLVAQGSHAELLQGSEFYRHLNYVRFNNFRDVL